MSAPDAWRPRLPRGVRLKRDQVRDEWLLLAPERVMKLDAVAHAVLSRCDGARTFPAIVDELAAAYKADRTRIESDVRDLLADLQSKGVVEL